MYLTLGKKLDLRKTNLFRSVAALITVAGITTGSALRVVAAQSGISIIIGAPQDVMAYDKDFTPYDELGEKLDKEVCQKPLYLSSLKRSADATDRSVVRFCNEAIRRARMRDFDVDQIDSGRVAYRQNRRDTCVRQQLNRAHNMLPPADDAAIARFNKAGELAFNDCTMAILVDENEIDKRVENIRKAYTDQLEQLFVARFRKQELPHGLIIKIKPPING